MFCLGKKHHKTLSRPLHSKFKKTQGLFKDLHRNLRTFQGLPLKFKDFSRLCEPCIISRRDGKNNGFFAGVPLIPFPLPPNSLPLLLRTPATQATSIGTSPLANY